MALKVIVSEPSSEWSARIQEYFEEYDTEIKIVGSGKDLQLAVFKEKYDLAIIDAETRNNSCFEVLRYLKINKPYIKIILTLEDKTVLETMNVTLEKLSKLGIDYTLQKPYTKTQLYKYISQAFNLETATKEIKNYNYDEESPFGCADAEFTRVELTNFAPGANTVLDLYTRLEKGNYLKILLKNDNFTRERYASYKSKTDYLYFKNKDRMAYIVYMNNLTEKLLNHPKASTKIKMKMLKNLSEKYLEEVYVKGVQSEIVEEGVKICDKMHAILESDKNLLPIIKELQDDNPSIEKHCFLVSFFATSIASRLPWHSKNISRKVVIGSMLHDIGKLKLSENIRFLPYEKLQGYEQDEYKNHPEFGVDLVSKSPEISEHVKQIIHQHHECVNGEGFPKGLTGIKIYPLAKIVSLADLFSNMLIEKKKTAYDTIRMILNDTKLVQKYDPEIVKAFIKIFIHMDS